MTLGSDRVHGHSMAPGRFAEWTGRIESVSHDVPHVKPSLSRPRETARIRAVSWEDDSANVSKDRVDTRVDPKLVDRDERVMNGGHASHISYQQLSKSAPPVTSHDRKIADRLASVDGLVDALHCVSARTHVD